MALVFGLMSLGIAVAFARSGPEMILLTVFFGGAGLHYASRALLPADKEEVRPGQKPESALSGRFAGPSNIRRVVL